MRRQGTACHHAPSRCSGIFPVTSVRSLSAGVWFALGGMRAAGVVYRYGTEENPAMAPMPMLVLLHSPLVGPLTWQPAATSLRAAGYRVAVPSLTGVLDTGPPYYPKLAGRAAETIRQANPTGAVALIGHSGAGALLPAAAEA